MKTYSNIQLFTVSYEFLKLGVHLTISFGFLLLPNSFWVEIRNFILSMNNQKISIRFFNDREVRAIWDDSTST